MQDQVLISEIEELSQKVKLKKLHHHLPLYFKMFLLVAKFHDFVAEKPHPPRKCGTVQEVKPHSTRKHGIV